MPDQQIKGGYQDANNNQGFINGELVTPDKLNSIAEAASILKGAITAQPAQSDAVAAGDETIINDVSDSLATTPKRATVSQILNAGLTSTFTEVSGVSSKISINSADGSNVTGSTYSYSVGDNLVTVNSTAHGLSAGEFVETTCTNTSGAVGTTFSGRFCVTSANVNSFTYKVPGSALISAGTVIWKKSGTVSVNSSAKIYENLEVVGDTEIKGALNISGLKSLTIPKGTTEQRPTNPAKGDIRYNTTDDAAEIWNGTEWTGLGGGQYTFFDGTGGDVVIAPDATTHENCNFTTPNGRVLYVSHSGHTVHWGQVVKVTSSTTGISGRWLCVKHKAGQFILYREFSDAPDAAATGTLSYRKSGNTKIHIFKTTGASSFEAGPIDGDVSVLVVGGGAGGTAEKAGAGGGVGEISRYPVSANASIPVVVGAGGTGPIWSTGQNPTLVTTPVPTAGGDSYFGVLRAGGGGTTPNPVSSTSVLQVGGGFSTDGTAPKGANYGLPPEYLLTSSNGLNSWSWVASGAGGVQICSYYHQSSTNDDNQNAAWGRGVWTKFFGLNKGFGWPGIGAFERKNQTNTINQYRIAHNEFHGAVVPSSIKNQYLTVTAPALQFEITPSDISNTGTTNNFAGGRVTDVFIDSEIRKADGDFTAVENWWKIREKHLTIQQHARPVDIGGHGTLAGDLNGGGAGYPAREALPNTGTGGPHLHGEAAASVSFSGDKLLVNGSVSLAGGSGIVAVKYPYPDIYDNA